MDHERWMREALRLADEAAGAGEVPVGCVVVRGDAVLGRGRNRREEQRSPLAHAEVLAIREACAALGDWRLTDCGLYVTLEPCPMCAGAMGMSRLGRCVFGAGDPDRGCCGSVYDLCADPALRFGTRWRAGVLADSCRRPLADFFDRLRED